MILVEHVHLAVQRDSSVSYLPVMPPTWASLPEDEQLCDRPLVLNVPEVIHLTELTHCTCGTERSSTAPNIFMDCTMYTLTEGVKMSIEVQVCHICLTGRGRYVGPDGRTEYQIRRSLRQVIGGESLVKILRKAKMPVVPRERTRLGGEEEEEEGDNGVLAEQADEAIAQRKGFTSRVERIPGVLRHLKNVDPGLGKLFDTHSGLESIDAGREPPSVYERLFRQVL